MQLTPYDIECINNAKNLIDADMSRHHTINEIAAQAGTSSTKLKKGFKEINGLGLYHYLHEQRMQKGIYLLENTHKTLKQISHILGYRYTCNFITAFKKRFGRTPRRW